MKFQMLLMSLLLNCSVVFAQWQQLNGPFDVDISSVGANGNHIFAGTLGDGLYVSYDNGQTWSLADGVPDYKYISAIAKSDEYIFAGEYRSTDNGISWGIMENGFQPCCITSLAASGSKVLAGAFNYNGVRISNDYGQTWTAPVSGAPGDETINTVAISGNNLFAGVEMFGAFLSTDNGAHWDTINNGLTSLDVSHLAICGTSVFASTFAGRFLSQDTGSNWGNVDNGLSVSNAPIAAYGGNLIALDSGKVFVSYDLGQSWISVNEGLGSAIAYSVGIDEPYIYVGTISSGVWRRPLSEVGLTENTKHLDFTIFPNPAVDQVTIQSQRTGALLSVYNLQGQLILNQQLHQEKTELNIDHLTKGVYIFKLVYSDKTGVIKFVKD